MPDFKIDPDYVEVAQRIRDLFAKHPNASLGGTYEIMEVGGSARVIYRATCHREPNDPNPGVGTAWEDVPGKTPYTRGSEIQNAETSAWGRAIVAVGASESKRIASADEMRSARARAEAPQQSRPAPAPVERIEMLKEAVIEYDLTEWVKQQQFKWWPWTPEDCDKIEERVRTAHGAVRVALGADVTPEEPPVMSRAESKANEAAKAALEPKPCPECGAVGIEPHAADCSVAPF